MRQNTRERERCCANAFMGPVRIRAIAGARTRGVDAALVLLLASGCACGIPVEGAELRTEQLPFQLDWADDVLTISRDDLPGDHVEVWYLEAYCRPGSTDRDWGETVIGHETRLVEKSPDGHRIKLACRLRDGVTVDHLITAAKDHVDFRLTAHNPTPVASAAHWAQPCIRVDRFTGRGQADYLSKSFVFIDGRPRRMPLEAAWATAARYTPGQVWCPADVDRRDVNPRPLSRLVPSSGLIGCYSADERWILATAWEPYQELFQGVIVCLHSDFRIGGLRPDETKRIRGKIYLTHAPLARLVAHVTRPIFPNIGPTKPSQARTRFARTAPSDAYARTAVAGVRFAGR